MAGLLGDVLPWVYSQGDRAKRFLGGLLSDPVGSAAQTAGLLGDKHREMQALQAQAFPDQSRPFKVGDSKALGQMADAMLTGPLGFAPAGITVWHGSPYKFDKFDSSKIGTGEGAQAYGTGHYTAEAKDVGREYAQSVKANTNQLMSIGASHGLPEDVSSNLISALQSGKNFDPMLDSARKMIDNPLVPIKQQEAARRLLDHEMAAYNAWSEWSQPGFLYKVDLPDDQVAKMLDWDKPLSQQTPDVQAALRKEMGADWERAWSNLQGVNAYDVIAGGRHGNPQGNIQAAEKLRSAGIPGIRYLDGGSRGAGGGTSNFVVFPGNEGLLSILERNGQPIR